MGVFSYNLGRKRSTGDSERMGSWIMPFEVAVSGAAGGSVIPLFDGKSSFWRARNLVERCGNGVSKTPFVLENGTELASGSSFNTSFNETLTAAAFTSNGNSLYVDLAGLGEEGNKYSSTFSFKGTFVKQASRAGTLTLGISLVGTDVGGSAVDEVQLFSDEIDDGTGTTVSVSNTLRHDVTYRLRFDYAYTKAASEANPTLTINSPGLQFVVGLATNGFVDLSDYNVVGGTNNGAGILTEWTGTPNDSVSLVAVRPSFLHRIVFVSVEASAANLNPGFFLGENRYHNNTNLFRLPPSTVGSTASSGVSYPIDILENACFANDDQIFLNNSGTTSAATVTYRGYLAGVVR